MAETVSRLADNNLSAADFAALPVPGAITVADSTTPTATVNFNARDLVRPRLGRPTVDIRFQLPPLGTDNDGFADAVTLAPQNLTVAYDIP